MSETVEITPAKLAEEFRMWDINKQAEFFSRLMVEYSNESGRLFTQMVCVRKSNAITPDGIRAMDIIGWKYE